MVSRAREGRCPVLCRLGCPGGCSQVLPQRQAQACLQSGHPGASHPPRTGSKEGLPQCAKCMLCPYLSQGNCHACSSHRPSRFKIKASIRPLGPAKERCRARSERPAEAQSAPPTGPTSLWPQAWLIFQRPGREGQDWSEHSPPPSVPWGCPASGQSICPPDPPWQGGCTASPVSPGT